VANIVVTIAKLIAGLASGSAAMLAEAGHSAADSVNEVFLWLALKGSRQPADLRHPLGHGRVSFLWALMAAIASFLIGGCLSIGLAIRELEIGGETEHTLALWLVLGIAFLADGTSLRQSTGQARREAKEHGQRVWPYLMRSSDPTLRAVVVEDSAALIGVALAAGGLFLDRVLDSSTPDAIASLLIGILLAFTAFGLARPLADFLIGQSIPKEQFQRLLAILRADPAVDEVLSLRAVYTGPEEVVVIARIHPRGDLEIGELTKAMDGLDRVIRADLPEVADVYLDVTTYRLDTLPLPAGIADRRT
jgi:cation diffusion facilitator family transporter